MNRSLIFLIALLGILAGCNRGGSVTTSGVGDKPAAPEVAKGQEATLLPFQKGNRWVYSAVVTVATPSGSRSTETEFTMEVQSVKPVSGGTEAVLVVGLKGEKPDRQIWRHTPKGLMQISNGRASFNPPQIAIPIPIDGKARSIPKSQGPRPDGTVGAFSSNLRTMGMEEVDTDMGRLAGLSVSSVTNWTNGKNRLMSRSSTWYKPGVGIIRLLEETVAPQARRSLTVKLKSHSLKGS